MCDDVDLFASGSFEDKVDRAVDIPTDLRCTTRSLRDRGVQRLVRISVGISIAQKVQGITVEVVSGKLIHPGYAAHTKTGSKCRWGR